LNMYVKDQLQIIGLTLMDFPSFFYHVQELNIKCS